MAITTCKDDILEIEPLYNNIPSLSCYMHVEMGYYLYALKDKWVFPFKKTKIKLNISKAILPSHSIGLITGSWVDYDVIIKKAVHNSDFQEITIKSKVKFPFKISQGSTVAILSIVPSIQCYTVKD